MGKIHISDDLRNKLNNVLSFKKSDMNSNSSPVAPAPSWNLENNRNSPPPPPPPPKNNTSPFSLKQNTEPSIPKNKKKNKKKKKKNKKYNYFKNSKKIFITSVITGIGLTFGLKLGQIIFY